MQPKIICGINIYFLMETTKISNFQKRNENSIRLLAFIKAKKGMGKELLEILSKLAEPTLEEEGNISYVPHISTENPNEILFDEIWMDNTSLDEHFKKQYMNNLLADIGHLIDKPIVLKKYKEAFINK